MWLFDALHYCWDLIGVFVAFVATINLIAFGIDLIKESRNGN